MPGSDTFGGVVVALARSSMFESKARAGEPEERGLEGGTVESKLAHASVSERDSPPMRRVRARAARRASGCVIVAACLAVTGCSDPGGAYEETQSSIQSTLDAQHLPVRSVSCTPRVGELAWTDPPAHLHCKVRFKDGASYTTPATV
jgi:hypothetical protein